MNCSKHERHLPILEDLIIDRDAEIGSLRADNTKLRQQVAAANAIAERLAAELRFARNLAADWATACFTEEVNPDMDVLVSDLNRIDAALAAYYTRRKAEGKEKP